MTTDFALTSPAQWFLRLIEPAVRAALLEVNAVVRVSQDQDPIHEPDLWSFEPPFVGPEWARS